MISEKNIVNDATLQSEVDILEQFISLESDQIKEKNKEKEKEGKEGKEEEKVEKRNQNEENRKRRKTTNKAISSKETKSILCVNYI